jgi:hypothetical protein
MTLVEFLDIARQVLGPFVPLLAVVFVVVSLIFGIIFAMVIMILRRV